MYLESPDLILLPASWMYFYGMLLLCKVPHFHSPYLLGVSYICMSNFLFCQRGETKYCLISSKVNDAVYFYYQKIHFSSSYEENQ